jgi:hypothetical protein
MHFAAFAVLDCTWEADSRDFLLLSSFPNEFWAAEPGLYALEIPSADAAIDISELYHVAEPKQFGCSGH